MNPSSTTVRPAVRALRRYPAFSFTAVATVAAALGVDPAETLRAQ